MSLDELVHELAPRVLSYCHGLTRDRSLAEDATQDALVALVRRWRRGEPPRSPAAFVFAIARRRALRLAIRRRLLAPFEGVTDRQGEDTGKRIEERGEVLRALGALTRLASRDRRALLLIAVAELDYREAASVLGVSVAALKMRVHRARARLAAILDGGGDERAV